MRSIIVIAALTGLCAAPISSHSYNNTVHYFLTVVVTENVEPKLTDDEKKLVSFCAQLPDETLEYDAMRQYQKLSNSGDYLRWARASNDDMDELLAESQAIRELITVQQLLHGLTGGNAREMLQTADTILDSLTNMVSWDAPAREKAEQLCAVGFAVHLLGDTLAHRRLDKGGLEADGEMYSTGRGHAFHGKRPDNILKSVTGLDGIMRYSNRIPSSIPEDRDLAQNGLKDFHANLETASKKWFRPAAKARQVVLDESGSWSKDDKFRPESHDNQTCQEYLNSVIPDLAGDQCVPDCDNVFKLYAEAAIPEFENSHPSRLPALALEQYFSPDAAGDPPTCPDSG